MLEMVVRLTLGLHPNGQPRKMGAQSLSFVHDLDDSIFFLTCSWMYFTFEQDLFTSVTVRMAVVSMLGNPTFLAIAYVITMATIRARAAESGARNLGIGA